MGRERILVVPHELAMQVSAEYMAVSLAEGGRLIYAPVSKGA